MTNLKDRTRLTGLLYLVYKCSGGWHSPFFLYKYIDFVKNNIRIFFRKVIILFFLYIIIIIVTLITILTIFTTIKIHIQNLQFSTDRVNGRHLNCDYKLILSLYLFNKIKYLKIDITKIKLENPKIKNNLSKVQEKVLSNKDEIESNIFKTIKRINFKIENLRLNINIGTEDAALTAKSVGVLSSILGIITGIVINKKEKSKWRVMPVYQNRNFLNVYLDSIIKLKTINIIMFFLHNFFM